MKLPFAVLGCVVAVAVVAGEVYLIAAAFDGGRSLADRFGYGFAALLVLIVAQRYETPSASEQVSRKHFDAAIEQLNRQIEDARERHSEEIATLQDRIDRSI